MYSSSSRFVGLGDNRQSQSVAARANNSSGKCLHVCLPVFFIWENDATGGTLVISRVVGCPLSVLPLFYFVDAVNDWLAWLSDNQSTAGSTRWFHGTPLDQKLKIYRSISLWNREVTNTKRCVYILKKLFLSPSLCPSLYPFLSVSRRDPSFNHCRSALTLPYMPSPQSLAVKYRNQLFSKIVSPGCGTLHLSRVTHTAVSTLPCRPRLCPHHVLV